jgi:hypothetical protein
MTLIETKTLGTAATSIEFTSIPQDGTDLVALLSLRSSRTPSTEGSRINLTFNSVFSSYGYRKLRGTGSAVSSSSETGQAAANLYLHTTSSADTSNTFSNNFLYIPNYAGSTNKCFSVDSIFENNATAAAQHIVAGLWTNTAAITSVRFLEGTSNNWVVGSTISLYKITKGSSGGVVVS